MRDLIELLNGGELEARIEFDLSYPLDVSSDSAKGGRMR